MPEMRPECLEWLVKLSEAQAESDKGQAILVEVLNNHVVHLAVDIKEMKYDIRELRKQTQNGAVADARQDISSKWQGRIVLLLISLAATGLLGLLVGLIILLVEWFGGGP